ncbi:MAG TPA: YciI family protein [Mycobacteriales bacterium]|nr:YciI family protein [Mycobacteriales bacterium]
MTKFLLMVNYDGGVFDGQPMESWDPKDVEAHLEYYRVLNEELTASGELVDGMALTGPELASIVRADGTSAPVITDGPFPEVKELLAGFQLVDVESKERALEIAAQVSAVPGPGGVPTQQPIEVRQLMGHPPGIDT